MSRTIQLRRDAAASWTSVNPVLAQGELAYETDTDKFKIGDGTTAWTSLDYILDTAAIDPNITATSVNTNTLQVAGIGYPTADGTSNQVLTTNGLGVLSFQDSGSSSFDGAYSSLSGQPSLFDGAYSSLTGQPSLFDGAYSSLTGSPSIPVSLTDLSISDGTANQVLTTNGSGSFTFADAAASASSGVSLEATGHGSITDGDPLIVNSDGTVSSVGVALGVADINELTSYTSISGVSSGFCVRIPGTTTAIVGLYGTYLSNSQLITNLINIDSDGVITKLSPDYDGSASTSTGQSNVATGTTNANSFIAYWDTNLNKLVLGYTKSSNNSGKLYVNTCTPGSNSLAWGTATELGQIGVGLFAEITASANNPTTNEAMFTVEGTQNGANSKKQTLYKLSHNGSSFNYNHIGDFAFGSNSSDSQFSPCITYVPWTNSYAIMTNRRVDVNDNRIELYVVSGSIGSPNQFVIDNSSSLTMKAGRIVADTVNQKLLVIYYHSTTDNSPFKVQYATVLSNNSTFPSQTPVEIPTPFHPRYKIATSDDNKTTFTMSGFSSSNVDSNTTSKNVARDIKFDTNPDRITVSNEYQFAPPDSDLTRVLTISVGLSDRILVSLSKGTPVTTRLLSIQQSQVIPNLTSENFVGISSGSYTDGATVSFNTSGNIDNSQTGLTAGQAYYIKTDGTISTSPDTPKVFAGVALSATKLLIAKNDSVPSYNDLSNLPSLFDGSYGSLTGAPSIPASLTDVGITDGTANQVLTTNGSGGFSFQTVSQASAEWDSQDVSLDGNSSITVIGIPIGVRQVIIGFRGQAGPSNILIQLGDTNGIQTSGYDSFGIRVNGTIISSTATSTSGFILRGMTSMQEGSIILSLIDAASNRWGMNSNLGGGSNTEMCISTGGGQIGAALSQIKISAVSGNFDAGSQIGVSYL